MTFDALGHEEVAMDAAASGDWLQSTRPGGGGPRRGLIVEVLGGEGHRRFLVRWDEEHEALHYPDATDVVVRPRTTA